VSGREEFIANLEALTQKAVPKSIQGLDDATLDDLERLLDDVLERERAGLDSLFSSMTHTMKYIPNLLLQSLTARYIEPPIAARICEELSVKQAVGVANGLDSAYVSATCAYMSPAFAAELLAAMNKKKARAALVLVVANFPRVAIAVLEHLPPNHLAALVSKNDLQSISNKALLKKRDALISSF